jgi:hypothetical protein
MNKIINLLMVVFVCSFFGFAQSMDKAETVKTTFVKITFVNNSGLPVFVTKGKSLCRGIDNENKCEIHVQLNPSKEWEKFPNDFGLSFYKEFEGSYFENCRISSLDFNDFTGLDKIGAATIIIGKLPDSAIPLGKSEKILVNISSKERSDEYILSFEVVNNPLTPKDNPVLNKVN